MMTPKEVDAAVEAITDECEVAFERAVRVELSKLLGWPLFEPLRIVVILQALVTWRIDTITAADLLGITLDEIMDVLAQVTVRVIE